MKLNIYAPRERATFQNTKPNGKAAKRREGKPSKMS
jgi:hypothetical protein